MTNQEILDYIHSETAHGISRTEIKDALIAAGWNQSEVEENLVAAYESMPGAIVTAPETMKAKSKSHYKIIAGLVVIVLFLAGGAFAAYKFIYVSPQKVLQTASLNMRNVKSFDFSGTLTAEVTTPAGLFSLDTLLHKQPSSTDKRIAGTSNVQFGVDFNGSEDLTDQQNPKTSLTLNLKSSIFTFGTELLYTDKVFYFKLDQIPTIAQEAAKYANTWIKVDPADITKAYGVNINLQNGQPNLTDGQKKQIEDLTTKAHLFNSVTKLADDSIDGVGMYHYSIVIDQAGLKNYLEQLDKINISGGGFTDSTSQAIDNIAFENLEIWIGKSDHMVYRTSGQVSEKPSGTSTNTPSGSVNFLLNFKNFNHPTPIVAPSSSQNIVDVVKDVMNNVQASSRDAIRAAEAHEIQAALTLYYNDHSRYPKALTDLIKPYLPVLPQAPTPPDGTCTASNNMYVYKQLKSGSDYSLSFCLGTDTGSFKAGLNTFGPGPSF